MLSDEGKKNCQLLQDYASQVWGSNLTIVDISITEAPFDVFNLYMLLYGKHEVLLQYETGTFATSVKINDKFIFLDKITERKVIYGFDSMIPESIAHNFDVLDKTLLAMN